MNLAMNLVSLIRRVKLLLLLAAAVAAAVAAGTENLYFLDFSKTSLQGVSTLSSAGIIIVSSTRLLLRLL